MAIKQDEFRLGRVVLDHRQGFDQANFVDGGDDLLIFAGAHHPIRDTFAGHQGIERNLVGLQIEAEQSVERGLRQARAFFSFIGLMDAEVHSRDFRLWICPNSPDGLTFWN